VVVREFQVLPQMEDTLRLLFYLWQQHCWFGQRVWTIALISYCGRLDTVGTRKPTGSMKTRGQDKELLAAKKEQVIG
jgi:hypothetical protein